MAIRAPGRQDLPVSVFLIITHKNGSPALQMRRTTTDPALIEQLVRAAYHEQPLIIHPAFQDKMRSIGSLIDKGILIREGEQYFFPR